MNPSTRDIGNEAEGQAAQYLQNKGYRIIVRNYRIRFAEIDIIAQKDDVLVFCEVKSSRFSGESHPEIRVGHKKQIKIAKCAQSFLVENRPSFDSCRFDIISVKLVRGETVVEHFENAFWPPDGWDD
ncbi:YraN family protein [candidate division LCP-89 bacterium B3_LCP]|uniref:UPF0102 protein CEE37_08150 n=1 Tax=candidate division LCP-89 bacterium B3_LCP TaxID=2012998 RepID=A0A532UZH7_UNCL8|nr:MAG: YraN family protein [candidate division LCP-89 bacterium B3_LCP]